MRPAKLAESTATSESSAQPRIGFWVIAHDKDPSHAYAMRQTWLRSEAHVRLCVAQGPHVGETGLTTVRLSREAVPWLDPEAHTSDAEARSLDGLHPRQTNNTEKLRARNQFLRAKVYAMLLLMCKAPEDFSLMLDDDTAVNVTGLREWLRTRAMATPADRFMLYGGHVNEHRTPTGTFRFVGGGAGILFSRAARGRLCTKPCLITCLAHMLGMIKADREAMGGDQMLGKCARDCQLPPTSIPGFGRHPLWVARGGRSTANAMITTHHTRPTNRTNSMEADPRCRVLHVPERSGTRAVDSGVMDYICAPAFAVIGAPKSGTTSLFAYLSQNPDIAAPKQKELHVFRPVAEPSRYMDNSYSLLKYSTVPGFPRVAPRDFRITGEASPAYFYHPGAARFFLRSGSLRAILLLRHPVARWLSEFQNRVDHRNEVGGRTPIGLTHTIDIPRSGRPPIVQ
jgi:hypothetical protein